MYSDFEAIILINSGIINIDLSVNIIISFVA